MQAHPAIISDADLLVAMGGTPAPTTCLAERSAYYDLALVRLAEEFGGRAVAMAIVSRSLPVELLDHLDNVRRNEGHAHAA